MSFGWWVYAAAFVVCACLFGYVLHRVLRNIREADEDAWMGLDLDGEDAKHRGTSRRKSP